MADEIMDEAKRSLVESILSDMERDGRGWVKEWSFAELPMNGVTGTAYRGRNALMLWMQMRIHGLMDPRFVTYNQATRAGCPVAKGSHGFPIERWCAFSYPTGHPEARWHKVRPAEAASLASDPDVTFVWRPVGHWTVFNASQLEDSGAALRPAGTRRENAASELADALLAASPCEAAEEEQGRAFYDLAADRITLPPRERFTSTESFCRTLIHKQCHATGATSRLDREYFCLDKRRGLADDDLERSYAQEELVAELGCVFAAAAIGLDLSAVGDDAAAAEPSPLENSARYLRGWAERPGYERVADAVLSRARDASMASDWLVEKCYRPAMGDSLFSRELALEQEPQRGSHAITNPMTER